MKKTGFKEEQVVKLARDGESAQVRERIEFSSAGCTNTRTTVPIYANYMYFHKVEQRIASPREKANEEGNGTSIAFAITRGSLMSPTSSRKHRTA
jgi:hypothetical protein